MVGKTYGQFYPVLPWVIGKNWVKGKTLGKNPDGLNICRIAFWSDCLMMK